MPWADAREVGIPSRRERELTAAAESAPCCVPSPSANSRASARTCGTAGCTVAQCILFCASYANMWTPPRLCAHRHVGKAELPQRRFLRCGGGELGPWGGVEGSYGLQDQSMSAVRPKGSSGSKAPKKGEGLRSVRQWDETKRGTPLVGQAKLVLYALTWGTPSDPTATLSSQLAGVLTGTHTKRNSAPAWSAPARAERRGTPGSPPPIRHAPQPIYERTQRQRQPGIAKPNRNTYASSPI
jgi:hypothetical protein